MVPPEPLAVGRDADVFAAGPGRVRRRYRDGRGVRREVELMRHLRAHGYPVPTVFDAEGPDLLMERVEGPTMAEQLWTGRLAQPAAGELLARLHSRLHAVPPPEGTEGSVLHLDLHPLNVLMSPDGPVVIDWSNARTGDPADDWATTALIIGQAATGVLPEVSADVTPLLVSFLAHAEVSPLLALGRAVDRRRRDRYQSAAELAALDEAVALVESSLPSAP